MNNEWVQIGKVPDNTVVEDGKGTLLFVVADTLGAGIRCEAIGDPYETSSRYLTNETLVRTLDLPFLLTCVTDKLEESAAFQQGKIVGRQEAYKAMFSVLQPLMTRRDLISADCLVKAAEFFNAIVKNLYTMPQEDTSEITP